MTVDLIDPCHDPEPEGWEAFRRAEGLTALWSYDFIRAAGQESWTPPILAVFRDGSLVRGVVGAVCTTLRKRPRRLEPVLLDVRLPGHAFGPVWHFAADISGSARRSLLHEFERVASRWLGWGLAGVVYRQVTEAEVPLVRRRTAIKRSGVSSAIQPIRWTTPAEWMDSLDPDVRVDLLRGANAVEESMAVEFGPCRNDLDPVRLGELIRHEQNSGADRRDPRAPHPDAVFTALTRRDDVSFVSYSSGGGLVAFGMYLHHPVCPRISWWGSTAKEPGRNTQLVRDALRRFMHEAILTGAETVRAAKGFASDKRALGFSEVPLKLVAIPKWAVG